MPNADIITNFTTAFYSRFTASSNFYNAMSGRLFEDQAPDGTPYPYAVYLIVSAPKEKTFSEEYTNIILQLSIFSSASSSSEIKLAYHYASVLFDECEFSITGSTLVWMKELNLTTIREDHTTPSGTTSVRHYAIEFDVKTSLD